MLVDDLKVAEKVIRSAISVFDCRLSVIHHHRNLPAQFSAGTVDAVIIDAKFIAHEADRKEFARVMEADPGCRVIILKGNFQESARDFQAAYPNLLVTYLNKPFSEEQFSKALGNSGITLTASQTENELPRQGAQARTTDQQFNLLNQHIQEQINAQVRQYVRAYCEENFAEVAKDFLRREIDRLTEKSDRHLNL